MAPCISAHPQSVGGFLWNWQRAASIIKFATFQRSSDQWNGINCCQLSVAAFMPLNSKCIRSKNRTSSSEKSRGKARDCRQ